MDARKKKKAYNLYIALTAIFISSLVTCNLIFQKFFSWSPFGYEVMLSVGILPYPVTFLVTDIVAEVFGKKMANRVVLAGLAASVFTLLIIIVATNVQATDWSPVSDEKFKSVFGLTFAAVGASLTAYLIAQFIDVQLFHFWKRVTKGKYLWLRNNASTFSSQFIDTFLVLVLLCSFGAIDWKLFGVLLLNGYLFKVIWAALDTPVIYVVIYFIRRYFGLKGYGAELQLEN